MKERSSFSGKLGFVLAAAGSAVGLGNIWRFPYLAARYGGGMFLLTYIVLAATLGFALMTAEIALGRKTGLSTIGAYGAFNKKWNVNGWLGAAIPFIITPYYSVIGGWVVKYLGVYIVGDGKAAAADGYFGGFVGKPVEPLVWFLIFMGCAGLVTLFGVEKGIEKVSKYCMPVLVVLTIVVAIYSMTLPGAGEGVKYFLVPDFANFSAKTVLAAMGQMFYSLSLAMGIMITYGSYMKKDVDIQSSVYQIEIFDSGIAILAGLMIVPAVFAFSGGDAAALNKGPSLMFVTLPKVFDSMAGGRIIAVIFFFLVFLAALTSAISLMETVVSVLMDGLKLGRKAATAVYFAACLVLGALSSLSNGALADVTLFGMGFLDFFDYISNNIMMPICAFLTCVFVGYVIKPKTLIDEVKQSSRFSMEKVFVVIVKYVAPICIVAILLSTLFMSF